MISEKRFSSSFTSFWQELLPSGEAVLRKINLEKKRYCPPLDSKVDASRRDLVSEIGFLLYKASVINKTSPKRIFDSQEDFDPICDQAVMTVERFRGSIAPPNQPEQNEAFSIATNLIGFFNLHGITEIMVSPKFAGCGFVDDCVGDILAANTLYEIKAGERNFRLVDIRQIFAYLALNYSYSAYAIKDVGFVNPRMGIFYNTTANELAIQLSGKSAIQVTSEIVEFISSGGVSR